MAPVQIPEGFVFIPRRAGENVAALLFDAVEAVGADRVTSVRTTTNGYHVQHDVAVEYQANLPQSVTEADDYVDALAPETGETEGTPVVNENGDVANAGETPESTPAEEIEALPVTADSTHAEIDDYAAKLDPAVEFPANTNKADKIALLEAARQPKTPDAE